MTRVDFYILKQNAARERFVCRLTEKVYKQGRKIVLHTDDEAAAAALDELLWTWRQGSFIPHELYGDGGGGEDCPVWVNHATEPAGGQHDVLINLGNAAEPPHFFSRFERVAEIVDANAQTAPAARQRYRFYQQRGYSLQTHHIAG